MNELYENKSVGGLGSMVNYYWSSTEASAISEYYAWSQFFFNGAQSDAYFAKYAEELRVRAVRAF